MEKAMRILVVDDEESLRMVMSQVLSEEGHDVTAVSSGEDALAVFRKEPFPLVFTDIAMGGMSGIELLQELKLLHPDTQVIIVTSHASLDTAITALRSGAYDYLLKPFEELDVISTVADRAIEKINLIVKNEGLIKQLEKKNEELEQANKALQNLAIRDGLTGLFNHRYFQEALAAEVLRSSRHGRAFSLIFLDVDFFKRYNDTHGHPEGDKVLRSLGKILHDRLRRSDILARYGGEEFVILLPETPKDVAMNMAEDMRRFVEEQPFSGQETQPMGKLTISMGIATFHEDGSDGSTLLEHADKALYQAKDNGRNTVCC